VCAYDPEAISNAKAALANNGRVAFAEGPYDAAEGADALVLVTEWGVFRSLDFQRVRSCMKQPILFDGRNQYDPRKMREMGFTYYCIGRPNV
ncbi:UDP binding domain-containing protein, partial [Myxococcota bacterium]